MKISAKIRKSINLIFKILLVSLVYLFLFFELSKHYHHFKLDWTNITSNNAWLFISFAILLMPINWLIESIKWQALINKVENVKLKDAIQAVFAGTAISIFTPNRIGDYLGRIFILKKGDRLDGTVATITGNISQLLVTILMGSVALIFFSQVIITEFLDWSPLWIIFFRILIILIDIALVFIFLMFPIIEKQLNQRFEIFKYPVLRHLNLLAEYNKDELIKVLAFSILRYLVYSLQFYFLLLAFNINIELIDGLMVVFLIFFGITIVPSIAVAELGIRAIITLLVFEMIGQYTSSNYEVSLVSTTSILWLINIAVPALIGGLFIFNLKFIRKNDFTNEEIEEEPSS